MSAGVGQVIVHCPACGAALAVPVEVANVYLRAWSVRVEMRVQGVDHECPGAP